MHLPSHCLHYLLLKVIRDGYLIPSVPIVYFNVQYSLLLVVLTTGMLFLMLLDLCFSLSFSFRGDLGVLHFVQGGGVNRWTITHLVGNVANVACVSPAPFWVVLYCHVLGEKTIKYGKA